MKSGSGRKGRTPRRAALLLAIVLATTASAAHAQELSWTGSVSYANGSYIFDATTHSFLLSNGLRLTAGSVDFSASIPFVIQNSSLVTVVGGATLPTGGEDSGAVGNRQPGETIGTGRGSGSGGSGGPSADSVVTYRDEFTWELGDPFFSAGVNVYEGRGFIRSVRAQASTKAPLRDLDSGVGTGEWDFGASGSAFASVGSTYVFVDVGYWWYGDMPDLELVDGLTYGAGVSRTFLDGKGSVMASFLGATAAIETMDRPASVGLSFGYIPELGRSFSTGLTLGLSESSPDISVYAGWTLKVK